MAGSFAMDLTKFAKKYDADVRVVVKKVAFEAFRRIILRTPVDTGRARANWGVSIGQPNTTSSMIGGKTGDKGGGATIMSAAKLVEEWKADGSIFLTNNLAYIGELEYGRADGSPGSKQAPNGMVRVTMEEMAGFISKANIGTLTASAKANDL